MKVEAKSESQPQETSRELPRQKWKPGCLSYLVTTVALLLIAGWATNLLWTQSARREFEAKIAEIKDRGEPVWFADLKPDLLPAAVDGTQEFIKASRLYDAGVAQHASVFFSFEGTHIDGTGRGSAGLTSQFSAVDLQNFREVVAASEPALDALRQALDKGAIRAEVDYNSSMPIAIILEFQEPQRDLSRVVFARGVLAVAEGDADLAISSARDLFRLADLTKEDGFLISQLVRLAVAEQGVQLADGILEHFHLTDDQRSHLDGILAEAEKNFRLRDSFIAERAVIMTMLTQDAEALSDPSVGGTMEVSPVVGWLHQTMPALQYQNMIQSLVTFDRAIGVVDETGPAAVREMQLIDDEVGALPDMYFLTKAMFPALPACHRAVLRHRQRLRGLRLALRVDRYYRNNGQFPAALRDVVDEAMPEVPLGTFSNKPVEFQTTQNGFIIYCVGADGNDGGGTGDQDETDGMIEITYPPNGPAGQR
ncbi:MAG: hypothetical protein MPJ50_07610 [Pirellulales bacterium]|nr:hypothetical protein [Pirellulales bacterium]